MATKWLTNIRCKWCGGEARVGRERDGESNTYRLICGSCGLMAQVAPHYPTGQEITREIEWRQFFRDQRPHSKRPQQPPLR